MAELTELKLEQLQKALASFARVLDESETEIVRDASIQRFEYSVELFWKTVQVFLKSKGIESYSPKNCLRELRNLQLLNDAETEQAIKMIDDRNLSVHTYKEELAEALYGRLPGHLVLMQKATKQLL